MTRRRRGSGDHPRSVGEGLEALARRLGSPPPSALAAVFARWDEAVGPAVAAHSRPVSLRAGVLVVVVDEPGWATQLRYLSATMVARLGDVAGPGTVERIEVTVGPPGRPGP